MSLCSENGEPGAKLVLTAPDPDSHPLSDHIGSVSEEHACLLPHPWLSGLRLSSPSQGQKEAERTCSAHVSGQAGGFVLDGETEAQTALTGRVQAGPHGAISTRTDPFPSPGAFIPEASDGQGQGQQ